MTRDIKKIGVFTSGGDCSGLNAIIYSIVRACEVKNIEVFGIFGGVYGLMYPDLEYVKLTTKNFHAQFSSMRTGGTILKSVNADKKRQENEKERFQRGVKELGLDSLIIIGGDGSAMIVSELIKDTDINLIAIPKTIDNDTPVTDYSIGFDTARNVCMDALDKIQTTAFSHDRVMIVEVMGRDAGHLALNTAIAGGADVCLIPEIKYDINNVVKKLQSLKDKGIMYSLVVVAEGCRTENNGNVTVKKDGTYCYSGFGNYISKKLEEAGILNRVTVLGHIQRGGIPTAYDRIIASMFGVYAINILLEGKTNRLVIRKDGKVSDIDLFEAVKSKQRRVSKDSKLLQTAKDLGIYIGEE